MKPPRVTCEVIISDPVRCRIFLERLAQHYRETHPTASPRNGRVSKKKAA